jgi:hypothetical protein
MKEPKGLSFLFIGIDATFKNQFKLLHAGFCGSGANWPRRYP